ncbi:phospholipase [Siculibacillus lacustris]|uniref:Phospholipase n=1 Tax=Siculibacillus lacustris TaxID=1549641 RepID=A0A4Q9VJ78_9HYPH|nr:dienelactone hydrolase family protein [Siculibacillus lacustris]TBW34865.1 phospholipase [Siculibacillus lacustris]
MPANPAPLVVLLHGVGASGRDLFPIAELIRSRLPGATAVAPDAPFAFDGGGAGRQWFSIAGVTEANRAARIAAAREAFDRTIATAIAAAGLTDRLDRVAFVGFSQGTIMTLDAVASGRWPIAAAVGFAGRLASPEPLTPSLATRLLLLHGDADPVIPAALSADAAATLTALGMTVERRVYAGLGHGISPEGAVAAASFLAAVFA